MKYIIYSDESCHLQHDDSNVMILGAMYCPAEKKKEIFQAIRDIKEKHGVSSRFEIKWTKVSESKIDFYLDLIEFFWDNPALFYRGLVCQNKEKLDHDKFNDGDYDLWYYKMYFLMLEPIIHPYNEYQILIDIKDTRGGKRIAKLHDVLCNNQYDFKKDVIKQIAQINSKDSEILQLADLFNGALSFHHRHLDEEPFSNVGKKMLIDALRKKCNMDVRTDRDAKKFNLFLWKPRV